MERKDIFSHLPETKPGYCYVHGNVTVRRISGTDTYVCPSPHSVDKNKNRQPWLIDNRAEKPCDR